MVGLESTFRQFQSYILGQKSFIEREITNTPQVEAKTRLQIYRKAYYLRLLEILSTGFRVLAAYLGKSCFDRLGRAYIDAFPSRDASILVFTQNFPDFLSFRKDISSDQLELAYFELSLAKAQRALLISHRIDEKLSFIKPDAWGAIQFILNPTIQVFESFWMAPKIWRAMDKGLSLPMKAAQKTLEVSLIWSGQGAAHFCTLDKRMHCFFDAFREGKCFGEVCETLCQVMPPEEVGAFAGHYLKQWIVDQIIVEYSE